MRFFKKTAVISLVTFLVLLPVYLIAGKPTKIGVTFSQVQCEYLELDWKEIYEKTLGMGFDIIRLGSYWSRIEKKEGVYDFSELDWQIKKAQERNIKVLLTLGMKAPRWPEFFIPTWLLQKIRLHWGSDAANNKLLKERTLEFIRQIVSRYKDKDCISAWQVENEPFNRSGPKELWIGEPFLKEEIAMVKNLDANARPVVVNAMTYPNKLLRFFARFLYRKNPAYAAINISDIPAFNVYPVIGHKLFSRKVCFLSNKDERNAYLKKFVTYASARNKKTWITELQAEPWEPGELVHLSKEPAITCAAGQLLSLFGEMNSLGIDTVFLWGVEYWYFRQEFRGDDSWISSALHLLSQQDTQGITE